MLLSGVLGTSAPADAAGRSMTAQSETQKRGMRHNKLARNELARKKLNVLPQGYRFGTPFGRAIANHSFYFRADFALMRVNLWVDPGLTRAAHDAVPAAGYSGVVS
jgi:hypothetical protein